jgi:hypothetical protein
MGNQSFDGVEWLFWVSALTMERNDLNLLPALDALLQTESVTGAARQLGFKPPAMSHALARLREVRRGR